MKNKAPIALGLMMLAYSQQVMSSNMISFFIRPFPTTTPITQDKLVRIIKHPGTLARKTLKALLKPGTYQGVLASYMGYITPSNLNGQVLFPRLHQAPEVKLLITQLIEPVMMLGATVHHFITLQTIPSAMYQVTRKQDNQTDTYYWDTQKMAIPANRRITLDTIILFAKPKNIVAPIGITETTDSPMLSLPDIYATKELNGTVSALRVLKIRNFFAPVSFTYKKQSDTDYAKLFG